MSLIPKFIQANFSVVREDVIPTIEQEDVRNLALATLNAVEDMLVASFDLEDPAPVIRERFDAFVELDVAAFVRQRGQLIVAEIENPEVRALASIILAPLSDSLSLFTDDVKPNSKQLGDLWLAVIRSRDTQNRIMDEIIEPFATRNLSEGLARVVVLVIGEALRFLSRQLELAATKKSTEQKAVEQPKERTVVISRGKGKS